MGKHSTEAPQIFSRVMENTSLTPANVEDAKWFSNYLLLLFQNASSFSNYSSFLNFV